MNDIHQRWKDKEAHREASKRIEVEEVHVEEIEAAPPPVAQRWVTHTSTGAE